MAKRSTSDRKRVTFSVTRKGIEIKEDGVTFAVLPSSNRDLAEAMVRFGLTRSQVIWLLYSE